MTQPQLWLRRVAFTYLDNKTEYHGVAVYASEYMCKQFEEQPMFIIPLDCKYHSDLVVYGQYDTIPWARYLFRSRRTRTLSHRCPILRS